MLLSGIAIYLPGTVGQPEEQPGEEPDRAVRATAAFGGARGDDDDDEDGDDDAAEEGGRKDGRRGGGAL